MGKEVRQNRQKMMNDRFCCYGTYNSKSFRCLIKCADKCECEKETNFLKWMKYEYPKQKEEKEKRKE